MKKQFPELTWLYEKKESLDENLKITLDGIQHYEPWGNAVNTWKRIEDAGLVDETESILEDLYPEGIDETALNDILSFEPEWLLNELGIADEEEVAMLDLDEE